MCVLRFFKNLVTPKNWPLLLYLLLNMALIYYVIVLVGFGGVFDFNNTSFLITTIAFFVGYLVILAILATPFGEAIIRLTISAKKVERNADSEDIYACFDEVYAKTLEKNPSFSNKVKLYYIDDDEINAFALGSRTLIINTGLLNLADDEIKGVLGHEFGHLVHTDSLSKFSLIITNWLVYLIFVIAGKLAFLFFAIFDGIFTALLKVEHNSYILARIARFIVSIVYLIWVSFGNLLVLATSRKAEYAADKYSNELGYGLDLVSALSSMDSKFSLKTSVLEVIYSTHPSTAKRIEKLGYDPADVKRFIEEQQEDQEQEQEEDQ